MAIAGPPNSYSLQQQFNALQQQNALNKQKEWVAVAGGATVTYYPFVNSIGDMPGTTDINEEDELKKLNANSRAEMELRYISRPGGSM